MTDVSDDTLLGVRILDLHLGVVAVRQKPGGGIEAPKPLIYGTAFPVLPGLFVTAGHVATDTEVARAVCAPSANACEPYRDQIAGRLTVAAPRWAILAGP